jgi:hypothetical protein
MNIVNWTYQSEEAQFHAENPPIDQRLLGNSSKEALSVIQADFEAEFRQFKDFLDGKLNMSARAYAVWYGSKLYYIEYPELFDKDVSGLEQPTSGLDSSDRAWIANTRKLIQKYHAILNGEPVEAEPLKKKEPTERQKVARTLQSKVCHIANRISHTVSRKEAFVRAWYIVRNGYEVRVVGVSFGSRPEALKRLAHYDPKDVHAFLVPENNPHDPNAIAVNVLVNGSKDVYRLGYVPKTETGIVRAFLGTVPELQVLDGDIRGARLRIAG